MWKSIATLVLVAVLALSSGCIFKSSLESSNKSLAVPKELAEQPAEIIRVQPAAGSKTCFTPIIEVSLQLTDALREGGAIALQHLKLTLDSADVTAKLKIRGTLDFPQSRADLIYHPEQPLSLGEHVVIIGFPTPSGTRASYQWTFTATQQSCDIEKPCPSCSLPVSGDVQR